MYGTGHISDQYAEAKEEYPGIRTVLMNGGGNDILNRFTICSDRNFGQECMDFIDAITVESETLVQEIIADGADIVYLSYLNDSASARFHKAMNYGMASAKTMLAAYDGVNGAKVKFADLRPFQDEHPDIQWLCRTDHTHPTDEASVYLADLIWDIMVEYDMIH